MPADSQCLQSTNDDHFGQQQHTRIFSLPKQLFWRWETAASSGLSSPFFGSNTALALVKMSFEAFKFVRSPDVPSMPREVEESIDNLTMMLRQERSTYTSCFDYLSSSASKQGSGKPNEHVNEGWRRKICEWSYEVVDHFGFDREVVSIALDYLDRVIANNTQKSGASVPRKEFQLVAVTSLYLAIKLHGETDAKEGAPRKLRITAFVELSRGLFSVETIETMERSILEDMKWKVNPPTSVAFIASLLRLIPKSFNGQPLHSNVASHLFEMARYLTELAVCVSSFSFKFASSEIAYSSILCSIDALRNTVPFAYDTRVAFLNAMAGATSLTPNTPKVRQACSMLIELCPSMFDTPEPATGLSRSSSITGTGGNITAEGGKTSPVCVLDGAEGEFTQRKRLRSYEESE